ncbi:MAG TPA: ABC transporter permease [Candidatus Acidoferrales bacterium]|nr:ABC transporter permease [Candidatus Acidoferrales bacterium]
MLSLRLRQQDDDEFSRELQTHLNLLTEENIRRGMSPAEARRQAHIRLGGSSQLRETHRNLRGLPFIDTLIQDLRYGLRMLRKSPGFTAVAVLTLALGIGANAAIFSIVDTVLLQPLPFKNAARLVDITEFNPGNVDTVGVSYPDYLAWKQQNTAFEETAAYFLIRASNDIVLGGPLSTERERYSTVTNSFFTILGIQPALGHGFSSEDEIPGGPKVFLVSDAVWRGLFGADPRAIGKSYLLDGENFTLVGVMPPGFDFPKDCGVWVPTSTLGAFGVNDRISHPYHVLGRLRPGVTLAQAQAQIESIQKRLGETYPKTDANWRVRAHPLLDEIVGNVRASLFVLLGAVGFILLIACTNVVNLMLARASVREREFGIRAALGAGRTRLMRQNLTESFLIVCLSLVFAMAIANWGLALIVSLTSIQLPRMESFHLSVTVLVFLAVVAAITTFLVGLAPAMQSSQQDPQGALREGQRGGSSGLPSRRLRGILVVSEVAVSLLLLSGAGLLLRSFLRLNTENPGFQPQHMLTMKIALPGGAYPKIAQTSVFLDQLLDRLRALPGVQSVATATTLPLSGESDWGTFQIVGNSAPDWSHALAADWRGVSTDYFRTLGIPLLRGREFTAEDAKNQDALIINEAMAKEFWPNADPLGQKIVNRDQANPLEIIGVVANVKGAGLNEAAKPEMYTVPRGQWYAFLILRTSQEPSGLLSAVREQLAAVDKGVPIYQVATMDQLLDRSLAPQRFNLFLLGLFAALALILAAVGLYGVLSFAVTRRIHEIGIRLALGAQPAQILRLIVRQGMALVATGLLLGVVASVLLTRLMASLLFGVSATDPLTFLSVAALLALVALAACYIPARRAMRVDPMTALRHE